jgi:hypothetical protein
MVRGLDRFKAPFEPFADRYVLIGGTACSVPRSCGAPPYRAVAVARRLFMYWDVVEAKVLGYLD